MEGGHEGPIDPIGPEDGVDYAAWSPEAAETEQAVDDAVNAFLETRDQEAALSFLRQNPDSSVDFAIELDARFQSPSKKDHDIAGIIELGALMSKALKSE